MNLCDCPTPDRNCVVPSICDRCGYYIHTPHPRIKEEVTAS
jgi:hypothetical protein